MEAMLAFGTRHTLSWAFQRESRPVPSKETNPFGPQSDRILTIFRSDSIVLCGIYYVAWLYVLPRLQHYQIRPEILSLADSAATHRLVKVPTEQLAIWESTHDPSGRLIVDQSEKEERTEILKVDSLKEL